MRHLILPVFALQFFAVSAYASTFGQDMAALGWDSLAWMLVISAAGGVVSAINKTAQPGRSGLAGEIVKDLLTSAFVGFLAFLLATAAGAPSLVVAFVVTISGYGGSVVLDKMLARYLRRLDADPPAG